VVLLLLSKVSDPQLYNTFALFTQYVQEANQRAEQIRQMVMQRPAIPPADAQEALPDAEDEPPTP
jgi:hypothetical protein